MRVIHNILRVYSHRQLKNDKNVSLVNMDITLLFLINKKL